MSSQSLWGSPDRWICDPFGYVFLPRAMLKIGEAIFFDEWTGREPYLATCSAFDPAVMALLRQRSGVPLDWDTVVQARQRFAGERKRQRKEHLAKAASRVIGGNRQWSTSTSKFAYTLAQQGQALHQAWKDEAAFHAERQAAQRYASVCGKVADALRSGRLSFGTRPREGGSVRQGQREWWETEGSTLAIRFERFALSRNEPFSIELRDDAEWICIPCNGLDAFLARLKSSHGSKAKPESDAIRHLTNRLKQNPDLKRADAEAECAPFKITQRGFRDRVWPEARRNAGLSATAPAGRKRQKNRRAKSAH